MASFVTADLLVSPAFGLCRSRCGRQRGAAGRAAAPRQRWLQHRGRPHRGVRYRARAAARAPGRIRRARTSGGAGAHRRRWRQPGVHRAPGRTQSGVLRGCLPAPLRHPPRLDPTLRAGPDTRLQVRKPRVGQRDPIIEPRDGAAVTEAAGLVDLSAWPASTRLIPRPERLHPRAQLRITDVGGHRIVGMLTTAPGTTARPGATPPQPRPRRRPHRQRQRHRDAHLPYHDLAQIGSVSDHSPGPRLLAWTQRLALTTAHAHRAALAP